MTKPQGTILWFQLGETSLSTLVKRLAYLKCSLRIYLKNSAKFTSFEIFVEYKIQTSMIQFKNF